MARYLSFRDGGKTNEEGIARYVPKFISGNVFSGLAVTQQAVPAMGVTVALGDIKIDSGNNYDYFGWNDADYNITISAADGSNPRYDLIVAYVDKSVVSSASSNNPNAFAMKVVTGTPAGSPTEPNAAAIQASVGASNPYAIIARVTVGAGVTTITNSNITDRRTMISITTSISGGGWSTLTNSPSAVTYNGNRNYSLTFSGVDLTSTLSAAMRLRLTRNTAAPTQCTSLNGSTQYYSKSSPAGMTFTDDFVGGSWIKMSSYPAVTGHIVSRLNGTSGWSLQVLSTGQVRLVGYNAGGANYSDVRSYQSVPLNKWVHVAAQLDMSAFTATTTTSYVMIDGVDVPAVVARGGTNPTALVQAGNFEVGSANATEFFPGKIAQAALFSAKVTQATIRGYISQGLVGTETSLAAAYSFNNSINDLTANANNLTANGSAVATNADSPFGNSAVSSTLEYGIINAISYSTDTTVTLQVPEGCAIPTTGTISATSYSTQKIPYGFPSTRGKWTVESIYINYETVTFGGVNVWTTSNFKLNVPIGSWVIAFKTNLQLHSTVSGGRNGVGGIHAATSNPFVNNVYNTKLIAQVPYVSLSDTIGTIRDEDNFTLAAAEDFVFKAAIFGSSGTETFITNYNSIRAYITAVNAYL